MAKVDAESSGDITGLDDMTGLTDDSPRALAQEAKGRAGMPWLLLLVAVLAVAAVAILLVRDNQSTEADQAGQQIGPSGSQAGSDGDTDTGSATEPDQARETLDVETGEDPSSAAETDTSVADADAVEVDVGDDEDQAGEDPDPAPSGSAPPEQIADTAEIPISVVGMSSLSNVPLRTNRAAYRFTADQNGEVDSVRLYYIVNTSKSGYANGTGGTVGMTVAPDDGNGLPDEANLFPGRAEAAFNLNGGAIIGDRSTYVRDTLFRRWDFSEPIPVEKGKDYHIIFQNLDPDPTNNYVSLDLVIDLVPEALRGGDPIPSPATRSEFGFVESSSDGWRIADSHREGHRQTPIFEVTYTDGNTQGQGFMQYEARATFQLTGSAAIRTTITVPEDRTVSQFAARVGAQAGGAVILEMVTMDGEVLRSVEAPTDAVANYRNAVWAEGTVEPLTLEAGTPYAFVVRAAPGYTGDVVPLQAGVNYGFAPKSVFPFGTAQTSPDGTTWTDWRSGLFYQSISVR